MTRLINKLLGVAAAFAVLGVVVVGPGSQPAAAKEQVTIAIISFSPYAPWYIVQEKGMAEGIDLDVRIIESIEGKNAGLTSGRIHCMNNTLDTVVIAHAAGVPIRVIAIPAMSYGLDEMVATAEITSVEDFPGKSYGADYGFLNHMWMLLTMIANDMAFDSMNHVILLPQEAAAAFNSGGLDIDVNYKPFSTQSLEFPGSHVLKTSFSDKTWERGLISESISCNATWLAEHPDTAKELLRAWFEAVDWWKENPEEGNKLIAAGLDWPEADVREVQDGAIMLNLDQNLGAFGIGDSKPLCASIPAEAPQPSPEPSGWGMILFGEEDDCVAGYLYKTWELFSDVYLEAGVSFEGSSSADGLDLSILQMISDEGYGDIYTSNRWIGRIGL